MTTNPDGSRTDVIDPNIFAQITNRAIDPEWAVSTGSQFSNSSPPARMLRFNDKGLFGPGATGWNGKLLAQGGSGSWLFNEGEGASKMSYLLVNSVLAGVTAGDQSLGAPYGVFGASRTPASDNAYAAIGLAGYAAGYSTGASTQPVWGGYFDAVKGPSSANLAQGVEIEITNLNSSPVAALTPHSTFVRGRTFGAVMGVGAGVAVHPTSYDVEAFFHFINNGAKARAGLVFDDNAITANGGGYMAALRLAPKMQLQWFNGTDDESTGLGFTIHGNVTDAAHLIEVIADNTGWGLYNTGGKATFLVPYVLNAVNYVRASPNVAGGPPDLSAQGTDGTISLTLTGKGTGGVKLRDGASAVKLAVDTTGISFYGGTTVAKPTVSGAKADGTALTNLLAALASLNLITNSTT